MWSRGVRAAGVYLPTGRRGEDPTAWEEIQTTTCMTCMPCATTMGICTEATTQVQIFCCCLKVTYRDLLAHFLFAFCFLFAAYCKNSIDGQWYCFDDSEVSPVADDDVCQQTAYILFYQRRTAIPSWSANSSVAGQYLFSLSVSAVFPSIL